MSGKINRNIVIFGGTGDLTYRKLMPALYNLFAINMLQNDDRVVVVGRREYTKNEYITIIKDWVKKYARITFEEDTFTRFSEILVYHRMGFTNINEYSGLSEYLCSSTVNQHIFYYAVSPSFFDIITDGIATLKCVGNLKLVIEKPFGEDLEDARRLNEKLIAFFGEKSIYRIDHYLGKEMIHNIQTTRFSNQIFKNSWNHSSIEKVEIIANEEVGVETRADYYDKTGALKDMVQNHLMQVLSLIAMEEPTDQYPIKVRQDQVFEQLRPIEKINIRDTLMLAQYEGYRSEPSVNPNSQTETYAMCKLFIDNERWQDVPFWIKTGKRMASREMSVVITFKKLIDHTEPDVLIFKVQPDEGVKLEFNIKKPGETNEIVRAEMDFCQSCILANRINTPEAYERLINATLVGDSTLFSTWNQIYRSWNYINQLKQKHIDEKISLYEYPQGCSNIDEFFAD